jgi:hypothetical protein
MQRRKVLSLTLMVVALLMTLVLPAMAQSTTKALSSNFTLVNLSNASADGTIEYYKPDGSEWRPAQPFTLAANGGQAIFRQYEDAQLTTGQGSVVVSSSQTTGSVVQILARGQNPTSSGAYVGLSVSNASFYVPLVARKGTSASGLANSQIVVQNAGGTAVDIAIDVTGAIGGTPASYTKTFSAIAPNASVVYDLATESAANIGDNFFGSAVVRATTAGGEVAVVSNFFTGDAMQTFNAFPANAPDTKWFVPLFTSKLPNTLNTPVTVQNLSGGAIAAGAISMTCKPDVSMPAGTPSFTKTNAAAVPNNGSTFFNPVNNADYPDNFYGACIVSAPANVVSFVQARFIATGEAAAYEAIKGSSTDKKLVVPLIAKRLPNGFATAVTIQNLNESAAATVTLTYTPSAGAPIVIPNVNIPAGGSLIQNQRTVAGVPELPAGWVGTLTVTSNQPLGGFVQLSFLREIAPGLPSGDNYMAHNAFTQPE